MNICQIIAEYLKGHRRLVVPQFGAFVVKSESGDVLFLELLKRDDGVLRELIMQRGAKELEAQGVIDRFVFEVRHTIESGSVYKAEGLGVFALGDNHNVLFRYIPSNGAESVDKSDVKGDSEAKESEEALPQESASGEVKEPISIKAEEQSAEPQQENLNATQAVEPKQESLNAIQAAEPQQENLNATQTAEPQQESLNVTQTAEPQQEKNAESGAVVRSQAEQNRARIKSLLGSHPSEGRSSSQPRHSDPAVKGLRYGKPAKGSDAFTYVNSASSRRPDTFVILAIVAVLIALGAILYGYFSDRRKGRLEVETQEELSYRHSEYRSSLMFYLEDEV